jgi:D-serine deaminase-like pyridoxal phosphate-dependent protein
MITSPTLLVNQDQCLTNIQKMADKARRSNTLLRPHFKTHQSAEIGNWFRDFGVDSITVSSVKMAVYFAANGWKDITIAFPVNILEWKTINDLAAKININLLVENTEAISFLEHKLSHPVGVFIKVDTGYGRTGIPATDFETMHLLLKQLKPSKKLIFMGFLCHAGHTYQARSKDDILTIHQKSMQELLALKTFLKSDFPLLQLSYGDTPSCSVIEDFSDVDEIRPGNFVFYDEMQHQIGSCSRPDIAVVMACPVVAKHVNRGEIIIHGGAVHLSKDQLVYQQGKACYGIVVPMDGMNWNTDEPMGYVSKLSQEHGILAIDAPYLEHLKIGDVVGVLPVHSCLTANLMKSFITTEGAPISTMI